MTSLFLSLFYITTYAILFLGVFLIKKSEKKINAILSIPVYVLFMMLYTAFFGGIIEIFGIPVNLISLGIGNILFAGGIFAFIIKSKTIQKYEYVWFDLVAVIIFAVFVFFVAKDQFGLNLFVNYETTDPSRHMKYAVQLIENQRLGNMYFATLNNAVFISVGLGFVKSFWAYKLFIIADILMFFLAGCVMYSAARKVAKKAFQKLFSIITIIFYLMCYPLNNMIFGFVYLGIGVSICLYLIMLANDYKQDALNKVCNIMGLMLGAYGIVVCYSLFAPFIFIAVASTIAIKFILKKRLISLEFFITEFAVFLIPTVMGVYFSFFRMFEGGVQEVGSSIALEGYIYRDLYSSFIIILPFTIYGIINSVRTKNIKCQHILLIILIIVTLGMFVMGMKGTVSSYYFYKMYYILSMVCFVVGIEAICDLCEKSVTAVISYAMVWVFLAGMNFGRIDDKITANKALMSPSSWHSGAFFSIIEFNESCMKEGNFSIERMQLYEQSHEKIKDGSKVTLLSTTEPIYWFEAMTQCDLKEFYCYNFDDCNIEAYMQNVEKCDYVLVYSEHDARFNEYISNWEVVYQNAEGALYSVK